MVVVFEQRVRMDAPSHECAGLAYDIEECQSLPWRREEVSPIVSSVDYVIDRAGKLNPKLPSHVKFIAGMGLDFKKNEKRPDPF